jgi:hypothetical protein
MTMNSHIQALQAYRIISRASTDAAVMQAGANLASLLMGGLPVIHLAVDGVCLGFQVSLLNEIGDLYGRPAITADKAMAYLRPNLPFILGNLALDKGLGVAVPILGIPFCYVFARALTWRLGAFFTATAALGSNVPQPLFLEKLAALVAELFPRGEFFFTLADPDKEKFIALVSGLAGLSEAEAEARITTALRVLRGESGVMVETEPEPTSDHEPHLTETAAENGYLDNKIILFYREENITDVSGEEAPVTPPDAMPFSAETGEALPALDHPVEINKEGQLVLLTADGDAEGEPSAPPAAYEPENLPLSTDDNEPATSIEPTPEIAAPEMPKAELSLPAPKNLGGRPKGSKSSKK